MGITTTYTFFDRTVIDSLWGLTWKDFFRMHPKTRAEISELVKFGYNVEGDEASDEELEKVFETKTLSWTFRRATPQFSLMTEIIYVTPQLRKHSVVVSTPYAEDCFAVVGCGIDCWVRGIVATPTLLAILKLHSFEQPAHWLDLAPRLATRVKRLVLRTKFSTPLYRWQGPEACVYQPFGVTDYERHNCLNVSDTRRFVAFLDRAWDKNRTLAFLKADTGRGLSIDPARQPSARFREVDIAEELIAKCKQIRTLNRPSVVREMT